MRWRPGVRPSWCPCADCECVYSPGDVLCGGSLPEPAPHAGGVNDMRLCIKQCDATRVDSYQINVDDIGWFQRLFDALQSHAGIQANAMKVLT